MIFTLVSFLAVQQVGMFTYGARVTRKGFIEMLKYYPLAMPKIYVSLF